MMYITHRIELLIILFFILLSVNKAVSVQSSSSNDYIHNYRYSTSREVASTMAFWSTWATGSNSWWSGSPKQTSDKQQQQHQQNNQQQKSIPTNRYGPYSKGKRKERDLVKKVTFVRHGCTYMNEYLSGKDGGKRFGSHDFTDTFTTIEQQRKYHDTPLSPLGHEQALQLGSYTIPPTFIHHCDLVVVSPLTRALQTFDIAIKPYLSHDPTIPIIALPEAAERLYLISDIGRPISELQKEFPYVDFKSGFKYQYSNSEPWWYQPGNDDTYEEWRPNGQQQKYACAAEPYDVFNVRMSQFYWWLQNRSETDIVVVCHHGVIDWMIDTSFANCQYKQLPFTSIKPRTLIQSQLLEETINAKL
jgi:broad specificity phosphatase PhoE